MAENRRHAAIMFTDIVGYTSLMGSDEDRAFKVLSKNREIHTRHIEQFKGTLIKELGDGMLISFNLASDAVRCAIEIQKACNAQEIPLKIGIHEGEVVFADSDVHGDGVNIASRIQSETQQGCINISASVYRDIKNKSGIQTKFIKEKTFKNVDEPIKVYQVLCENEPNQQPVTNNKEKRSSKNPYYLLAGIVVVAIAILIVWKVFPSKSKTELEKSIAVKPFWNESNDTTNMYFVNGMMEDIRNNLSKISDLRVISRTTMERYRETKLTASEIAKELGVSYLLEGSVQKIGNQVKVHAQLINAEEDDHIWQDTYIKDISDIKLVFEIQSDIAKTIAEQIGVNIKSVEGEQIDAVPTRSPIAYDYYLRGRDYRKRGNNKENMDFAIHMYEKAVEIDTDFVLAWVGLAETSRMLFWLRFGRPEEHLLKAKEYLDKAKKINTRLMEVRFEEGCFYYHCERNYPKALNILEQLKVEYPNNDLVTAYIGYVLRRMGEFRKALEYQKNAILLNPHDGNLWLNAGFTFRTLREYSEAEFYIKKSIELNPIDFNSYVVLLGMYSITGQIEKAKELLVNNKQIIDYPPIILQRANLEILAENYQSAVSIIESLPINEIVQQDIFQSKQLELGLIYRLMKNEEMATKNFNMAKTFFEDRIQDSYDDPRPYSSLALVFAGLGLKEQALELGNKALEIMNFTIEKYGAFATELDMVKILLMVGEYDEALVRLDIIIRQNGSLTVEELKLDPFWNPVRDMEGFKAIIDNPEYQPR